MSMIQDPAMVIENISNLSGDHHPEVAKLIEAFETVSRVHVDTPSLAGLTDPEKVEEVILEIARVNALNAAEPGKLSPIQQARSQAYNQIRRQAVSAVQKSQQHYIDQKVEMFNEAAGLYAREVVKLPTEFDTVDVADFSAEQFEAYRNVRNAVAVITSVRSFLNSLPDLSAQLRKGDEVALDLLILNPGRDQAAFNAIQFPEQPANATIAKIAPHYRAALELGARFEISTVAEATQTYRKFGA